jgi:hypothetical protein
MDDSQMMMDLLVRDDDLAVIVVAQSVVSGNVSVSV